MESAVHGLRLVGILTVLVVVVLNDVDVDHTGLDVGHALLSLELLDEF